MERAAERAPAAVLIEVNMPGVDGVELARRLRGLYGGDVTLVAMSGDENALQHASMAGLVDHSFAKPVGLHALMKIFAPSAGA